MSNLVALSDGEWTSTIASLSGTMTGPIITSGGKVFQPTNLCFETSFATIDFAEIMRQIGGIADRTKDMNLSSIASNVRSESAKEALQCPALKPMEQAAD
jgi:hypothetical protein